MKLGLYITVNDETRLVSLWDKNTHILGERTVLLELTEEQRELLFPEHNGLLYNVWATESEEQ
jgi:hypothetical protein